MIWESKFSLWQVICFKWAAQPPTMIYYDSQAQGTSHDFVVIHRRTSSRLIHPNFQLKTLHMIMCDKKSYHRRTMLFCSLLIGVFQFCQRNLQPVLHPQSLTWNLKMMVSKGNLLFQGLIFRFHVKLKGCTVNRFCVAKSLWNVMLSSFYWTKFKQVELTEAVGA